MELNLAEFSKVWPPAILAASRKLLLYPPEHPAAKNAIIEPFNILCKFISSQEKREVTLCLHGGRLLVNGSLLETESSPVVWLISTLEKIGIESVTLTSEIREEELSEFIRIIITKPEFIKERGGVREALGQKNITHIMVNEVRYAKVREIPEEEPEAKKAEPPVAPTGTAGTKKTRKRIGIKEYKALEKSYREVVLEKERIDNVIRNIAEGLVVVDSEGKVLLMNPAAERLLGVSQNEKKGKKLADALGEGQMLALSKDSVDEAGKGTLQEIELISPDDSTKRVLRASTAVVENQDGRTVGMVSVLSDITKQKEIDQLKSDFISHVSHELRTPLIAIEKAISLTMGVDSGVSDEDRKNFMSIAQRNLQRLTRLISDLLDISKIEAGKMRLNLTVVDLGEVVQHVLDTLDTWAKTKDIKLEKILYPDKIEILMDTDRMVQVLTNLIGNGIKFTNKGGSISVEVKERPPDELFPEVAVQVTVQDTGIGIDYEDIKRIFDKFEQVKGVNSSGVGGTGLGLPIAKEIIQMHGGKIWAESSKGCGSKFTFLLPQRQIEERIEKDEE